jgi:hypothetical protein
LKAEATEKPGAPKQCFTVHGVDNPHLPQYFSKNPWIRTTRKTQRLDTTPSVAIEASLATQGCSPSDRVDPLIPHDLTCSSEPNAESVKSDWI